MEEQQRRRRGISSNLGSVNLGDSRPMFTVDDPTDGNYYEDDSNDYESNNYDSNDYDELPTNPEEVIRRTFASTSEPRIENVEHIESQLKDMRQEKLAPKASRKAISRLELLTGIGRVADTIEIENVSFSLRSLKSKEFRKTLEYVSKLRLGQVEEVLMLRICTLALSLYEIDGNPLSTIIGSHDLKDKVEFIDDLEESTIQKLWSAYSSMVNVDVSKDLGKDSNEIVDNIKKS